MIMTEPVYLAGKVRRWHTHHSLTQTVADHAHGVATLIALAHKNPSVELLKAALLHDHAEYYTGDIPSPAKKEWTRLKHASEDAETQAFAKLGVKLPPLSYVDDMWLGWADALEALMFLRNCSMNFPIEQQMLTILQHRATSYAAMLEKEGETKE